MTQFGFVSWALCNQSHIFVDEQRTINTATASDNLNAHFVFPLKLIDANKKEENEKQSG